MASATGSSDISSKNLNLTPEEKRVFRQLFQQADTEGLEVVTGEVAVKFFEKSNVPAPVLGEIWQIADTENRGLLTPPGFSMALRLIGHYQAGREPTPELAYRAAPLPKFDGINVGPNATSPNALPPPSPLQAQPSGGPIRVPALLPERASEYASLFARSGLQNGILPGESAKQIFEKARLPIEVLGQIWNLADTERRGMLDVTEFIIAMHLIASYKSGAMRALPQILPPGLYEAASRRGGPASSRSAIPRQFTGTSVRPPQSPISRPPQSPPPQASQTTSSDWLISAQEKAKFDSFYATLDTEGRGYIAGDQAVGFFSNSGLSEDILAQIWDLADIRSEGQLNRDEFAVAMYLIWQQRSKGGPVPSTLPPALVPPSMRGQTVPSPQPTAPTFDNAAFGPQQPKSAAEDLFGLDALSPSAPEQAPQPTGGSTSGQHHQFASSKAAPVTSAPSLPPAQRSPTTAFKPFMPTSSFGQSLTPQTTGISQTSNMAPPNNVAPQSDDLLGDNDPEISSKLTQETAELANMSNQIGTLRSQMQDVQGKKAARGEELSKTSAHRRELEQRLTQFRTQYEQEVKEVKSLEEQLVASRNSTQKLSQDLAMLEGTHQDLQSKHRETATALEADRRENAGLKERIRQINEEVYALKPQLEKLKSEARQQKGMTAINRKQLATNEAERNRLKQEIDDLTRNAEARAAEARAAEAKAAETRAVEARAAEESARSVRTQPRDLGSSVPSPAASVTSHGTNPFFRKTQPQPENAMSPGGFARELPSSQQNQSSFDSIFGPSFSAPPTGPPRTSFRSEPQPEVPFSGPSGQSVRSSEGPDVATPSTTPPLSSPQESPHTTEAPPPPDPRQVLSSVLPVEDGTRRSESFASTANASAPSTRQGPSEMDVPTDAASKRDVAEASTGLERADTIRPQPRGTGLGLNSNHNMGSSTASSVSDNDRPEADSNEPTTPVIEAIEESIPGAFPGRQADPSIQATPTGASTASSRASEDPHPPRGDPFSAASEPQPTPVASQDDFDNAFTGFRDPQPSRDIPHAGEASVSGAARNIATSREEFPPIQDLHGGDESDSDDDHARFADDFASSQRRAKQTGESQMQGMGMPHNQADLVLGTPAAPDPSITSAPRHSAEQLPSLTAQKSPPTYEQTYSPKEQPRDANQFPPESSGLLPSREVPTSSHLRPMERGSVQDVQPNATVYSPPPIGPPVFTSVPVPPVGQQASGVVRDFPWLRNASQPVVQPTQTSSGDDFDAAFDDLEEARADKGDDDFTLVSSQHADEFNATFDTPASTTTFPLQSNHSPFGPVSNLAHNQDSFTAFEPSSGSPQQRYSSGNAQPHTTVSNSHDWDAIFSGLDSPHSNQYGEHQSNAGKSPFGVRPEERTVSQTGPLPKHAPPQLGRALSSGTEHDDPILKRLTGMGYARGEALAALEKFDYNIAKAADYLASTH